ncbi:MAG TPA: ATP-binding cassette domain-containing protein, partial [Firmicutes bacterium]|nr:ATP-binding cassette domain-containing protein [Bacillota bacterium]
MLQVEKVNTFYGDLQALREVSLAAHPGEIVAVVGSNGAGKSSLLKTIAGLIAPRGGTISFAGQRIDGLPAHRVCSAGIVLVPEGRGIFPMMTVLENLEMGAFTRRRDVKKRLDEVLQVFPVLAERRHQLAGTLSGGEQQMLAIGR